MASYYLIFFIVALLLFAAIALYSLMQQRRGVDKRNRRSSQGSMQKGSMQKGSLQKSSLKKGSLNNDTSERRSVESTASQSSAKESESQAPQRQAPTMVAEATADSSSTTQAVKPGSAASVTKLSPREASSDPAAGVVDGTLKVDQGSQTIVTELVARVKNPQPIEQHELLALFRLHDYKFHRNVHIYGLNQLTDLWRDIEFELPTARFVELGVSIQLADREGGMSKKELHDFQQMALEFSNKFDAPFEFSVDIDEALEQAKILDQIGRRYDSMAVLNVVPKSKLGFRMADIESCARDLMMSADKNGIFMKTEGQKYNLTILYRLACTDGSGQFGLTSAAAKPVHDLVMYMNVPATHQPEVVFQQMIKDATNLSTWLDGKVVDRHGKVMTQRSYSTLMQQISDIAFSMQQDGLLAGDAVSKKLF